MTLNIQGKNYTEQTDTEVTLMAGDLYSANCLVDDSYDVTLELSCPDSPTIRGQSNVVLSNVQVTTNLNGRMCSCRDVSDASNQDVFKEAQVTLVVLCK